MGDLFSILLITTAAILLCAIALIGNVSKSSKKEEATTNKKAETINELSPDTSSRNKKGRETASKY